VELTTLLPRGALICVHISQSTGSPMGFIWLGMMPIPAPPGCYPLTHSIIKHGRDRTSTFIRSGDVINLPLSLVLLLRIVISNSDVVFPIDVDVAFVDAVSTSSVHSKSLCNGSEYCVVP